jgi:hypothetical protein
VSLDFASIGHFFTSLFELTSFNHAQCDAILNSRHIEVWEVFEPYPPGSGGNTVYDGLIALPVIGIVAVFMYWAASRPDMRGSREATGRPYFLFFAVIVGMIFCVHLEATARYVDTCRTLLRMN